MKRIKIVHKIFGISKLLVAGKNLDKDLYGDDLDRIISTNRFVPDKGFSGAEPGAARNAGPVEVCLICYHYAVCFF